MPPRRKSRSQPSPPRASEKKKNPPPTPASPAKGAEKFSRTEIVLVFLTLLLPFIFHCFEMCATNPSYCPSFLSSLCFAGDITSIQAPEGSPIPPPYPDSSSHTDLFSFLSSFLGTGIKSKEPTPELLRFRSLSGAVMLEVLGLFSFACRCYGRKEPEQFIDIMMEFLPDDNKVTPIIYVFGRVFFRLDGISILNSLAKAGEAIIISLYLVSFTTMYAGGESLNKILKLIVVFNVFACPQNLFLDFIAGRGYLLLWFCR